MHKYHFKKMSPCHRETDGTGQQTFLGTYAFGRKFDTCKLKHQVAVRSFCTEFLLYRQECFTGKYTTRKIHTQLHPGTELRIFHILTCEDIDDVISLSRPFVQTVSEKWRAIDLSM